MDTWTYDSRQEFTGKTQMISLDVRITFQCKGQHVHNADVPNHVHRARSACAGWETVRDLIIIRRLE